MAVKNDYYTKVNGMFDFADTYEEIIQNAPLNARLVEVGSWQGRSIIYLATYALENGRDDLDIWCVDTWAGNLDNPECLNMVQKLGGSEELYQLFLHNIKEAGVDHIIKPKRSTSLLAAPDFLDGSCYFVFIDASHAYQDVVDDINAWWPKVQVGGVLAGHDYVCPAISIPVHKAFGQQVRIFPSKQTWWVNKNAS